MPDTTWRIVQKRRDDLTADALTADWPTVARGETSTLRLWFDDDAADKTLVVQDGETHTVAAGESETYQRGVVEDGGGGSVDGSMDFTRDGVTRLLDYIRQGGDVATIEPENFTPKYRRQHAGGYVDSLVLGFEPSADLRERSVRGLWGIVMGGSDERNSTLTNWQAELDVFVLGWFDEFSDHFDLETRRRV